MNLPEDQLEALRGALSDDIRRAGSLKTWAMRHGLTKQYVSAVAKGRRPPSDKIITALNFRIVLAPVVRG